ncbi:MAG: hypothetical protein AB4058_01870, partial [Microcystaceae cyanobacterium]
DANNNLYVTGATEGNLGGTNGGERDGWIGKYDSDGNQQSVDGKLFFGNAVIGVSDTQGKSYCECGDRHIHNAIY